MGSTAYRQAFSFLRKEGMRHWYVIIAFAALMCMFLVREALDAGTEWLEVHWLAPFHGKAREAVATLGGDELGWIAGGVEHTMDIIVFVLGLWLQLKLTKFIVLIALSPLFAILAEWVARRMLNERETAGGSRGWWWSLWRGLRSALLLVGLEMFVGVIMGGLFLLVPLLIPVIGLVTWWLFPLLSGAVSTWFYGAALLDYAWEQEGLNARQSLRMSLRHLGAAMALGLPFLLTMSVPLVGWLTGPLLGGLIGIVAALLAISGGKT